MFARTSRLLLRPAFPEDRPALAALLSRESLDRNAAMATWPHAPADAETLLADARDPTLPSCLIVRRTNGAPELIGACGLGRRPSGAIEMGYWIARGFRREGYASEACSALLDIARTLGLPSLQAAHFAEDAASARLLEKLGFQPIGVRAAKASCVDGSDGRASFMRLALSARLSDRGALAA